MNFKVGDKVKINEEWYFKSISYDNKVFGERRVSCYVEYTITQIKNRLMVVISDGETDFLIRTEGLIKANKEKEFINNDLCGRRFKLLYKSYGEMLDKVSLLNCNPKYIEGAIENFNPLKEIVLNDAKFGFNIIPYQAIIYMEEIKESENFEV